MTVEVKFCGMTSAADVAMAESLGARYVGVVFAGGPRMLVPSRAAAVLGATPMARVGVFGPTTPESVAESADAAELDVAQLHGDPTAADVDAVRRRFGGAVWAVSRIEGVTLPPSLSALFAAADAVVLDARVAGALGGTGTALDWRALSRAVAAMRRDRRLVIAGGLRPDNVREAIAALEPDVVDVSSGVERSPGVKDHARMRAFAEAVASAPARAHA